MNTFETVNVHLATVGGKLMQITVVTKTTVQEVKERQG